MLEAAARMSPQRRRLPLLAFAAKKLSTCTGANAVTTLRDLKRRSGGFPFKFQVIRVSS